MSISGCSGFGGDTRKDGSKIVFDTRDISETSVVQHRTTAAALSPLRIGREDPVRFAQIVHQASGVGRSDRQRRLQLQNPEVLRRSNGTSTSRLRRCRENRLVRMAELRLGQLAQSRTRS